MNQQLLAIDKKQSVEDYRILAYWQEFKKSADSWSQHTFKSYLPIQFSEVTAHDKPNSVVRDVLGRALNFLRTDNDFV